MDKLDDLILTHLAERELAPERLHVLISELRKRVARSRSTQQRTVQALENQLKDAEARLSRLYEAVEGVVSSNWMKTLGKRVQTPRRRRRIRR